jgi:hypothetical protein
MSATNRASLITKTFRALKKRQKGGPPSPQEAVLGKLLFACCLENASHAAAAKALKNVLDAFFDLNEIRVSSVRELVELMPELPDPTAAATRLKRVLQSVFETHYSFDLEALKKLNLGVADKKLHQLKGVTTFGISYVTQMALGGHAIPLDEATLGIFGVLGVIDAKDAASGVVPGLTRAISKSQGPEFFYLVHELGAAAYANPNSNQLRELLTSIASDAGSRWPPVFPRSLPSPVAAADVNGEDTETLEPDTAAADSSESKRAPARKRHEEKPTTSDAAAGTSKAAANKAAANKAAAKGTVSKKAAGKSATANKAGQGRSTTSAKKPKPVAAAKSGASKKLVKKKPK